VSTTKGGTRLEWLRDAISMDVVRMDGKAFAAHAAEIRMVTDDPERDERLLAEHEVELGPILMRAASNALKNFF